MLLTKNLGTLPCEERPEVFSQQVIRLVPEGLRPMGSLCSLCSLWFEKNRCYGFFASGFEKSTVGGPVWAFADAVKYFRGFAPVTFAVITVGNWRMYAL